MKLFIIFLLLFLGLLGLITWLINRLLKQKKYLSTIRWIEKQMQTKQPVDILAAVDEEIEILRLKINEAKKQSAFASSANGSKAFSILYSDLKSLIKKERTLPSSLKITD